MSRCFSTKHLERFLDAQLPDSDRLAVDEHVAACPNCQAKLEQLSAKEGRHWSANESRATPWQEVGASPDFLRRLKDQATSIIGVRSPRPPSVATVTGLRIAIESASTASTPILHWNTAPAGYEIIDEIGHGGMGVVYKARHLKLNRIVALKMIPHGAYARQEEIARFVVEANAIARLQHPNIVAIYEIGEHDGLPFFSLEYINGGNLADFLDRKPISAGEAAALVETLARAVQSAHQHGVLHRDLKPSNVLLSYFDESVDNAAEPRKNDPTQRLGVPKIADFGLAKQFSGKSAGEIIGDSDLTQSGAFLGTPGYVAPEIAAGKHQSPSPLVDVYGLGAILYECLTGRAPFVGETLVDTLRLAAETDPVPPTRLAPRCPRELETLCLKALARNPDARYPSAAELADDLSRFGRGEPIKARRASPLEYAWRWSKRRPALAALLLLSAMVVGIGFPAVTYLWFRADSARGAEARERSIAEAALYASRIALADQALRSNDAASAQSLLETCMPSAGQPDPRGWEWHYLNRRCHGDLAPGMKHDENPEAFVHAVCFDPNSKRLASVAGLPIGSLAGHEPGASGRVPGDLKLWDSETGQCLARFSDHGGSVLAVAFSPDGRWLASGGGDGSFVLRNGVTLNVVSGPKPQVGSIQKVAFSHDGKLLAIAGSRGLLVWDLVGGRERFSRSWSEAISFIIAFNADGSRLLLNLGVWDGSWATELLETASGKKVDCRLPSTQLHAAVFGLDSKHLFLAYANDFQIQSWDAGGTQLTGRLVGHVNEVRALASGAGGLLASGGDDQTVRVWNADTGKEVSVCNGHTAGISGLAFDKGGQRLASASKDGTVRIWNPRLDARGNVFRSGGNGGGEHISQIGFADAGKKIVVVQQDLVDIRFHNLDLWDTEQCSRVKRFSLPLAPLQRRQYREFAIAAEGAHLVSPDSVNRTNVHLWDTHSGNKLATVVSEGATAIRVAVNADGRTVAYSGWDAAQSARPPISEFAIVDVAEPQRRTRLTLEPGKIATRLAFSLDATQIAAVVHDFSIRDGEVGDIDLKPQAELHLWDARTGRHLRRVDGSIERGSAGLSFDALGQRIVATDTKSVRIWDAATGVVLMQKSAEGLFGVAFSPDGKRIATAGMDNKVRIWDARTGNGLMVLTSLGLPGTGHYGFSARVLFSPDGRFLIANAWDTTISVWDAGI